MRKMRVPKSENTKKRLTIVASVLKNLLLRHLCGDIAFPLWHSFTTSCDEDRFEIVAVGCQNPFYKM